MKKILFFIFLAIVFAQQYCYAENLKQIDLKTAIEIAQKNNLDIKASKIDVGIAKNDIKVANKLQNPAVQTFFNFGEAGRGNPNQVGVSETIELFKRSPRKNLAKANYKKVSESYDYDKFNLKMDVAEAYIRLVVAKAILKKYEAQHKYLAELLEITKKNNGNNDLSLGLIQSDLALNEIFISVHKAKANAKTARIEFNRIMNIPDSRYDTLDIDLEKMKDITGIDFPVSSQVLPKFNEIKELAVKNRYDIKIAKKQIDIAEKNLIVVMRQLVPDIEISSGYAYQSANYSESGTYKSGAYLAASLVNIPLFYTYKPEIKNAKLEVEKAYINYESTFNKAKKSIEIAYTNFVTAQFNLNIYNKNILKKSENLFIQFEKLYNVENVDFAALVSIEETYNDLIEGYSEALSDYYVGWINFLRETNTDTFSFETTSL